jgi:hypothetical protein
VPSSVSGLVRRGFSYFPWCAGARVLRTPSHVNASLTAAIVVRSLLAALGFVWVVGLLVGWIVDRLAVCWPVSWDVVMKVDIVF